MINKALALIAYCLRWLAWAVHYLVIWPAATLMLLIVLLFRLDNTTPGKVLAQEIASVTYNVGSGEYRLSVCGDGPFIPALSEDKTTAGSMPVAPSAICHKPVSIITDAKGYAADIDGSLNAIKKLWIVMAVVFAGLALMMKRRPDFRLNGQSSSDLFRSGTPAGKQRQVMSNPLCNPSALSRHKFSGTPR